MYTIRKIQTTQLGKKGQKLEQIVQKERINRAQSHSLVVMERQIKFMK